MDVLRHWAYRTDYGWLVAADVNHDAPGPTMYVLKEDAERLAARLNDHQGAVEALEAIKRDLTDSKLTRSPQGVARALATATAWLDAHRQ